VNYAATLLLSVAAVMFVLAYCFERFGRGHSADTTHYEARHRR